MPPRPRSTVTSANVPSPLLRSSTGAARRRRPSCLRPRSTTTSRSASWSTSTKLTPSATTRRPFFDDHERRAVSNAPPPAFRNSQTPARRRDRHVRLLVVVVVADRAGHGAGPPAAPAAAVNWPLPSLRITSRAVVVEAQVVDARRRRRRRSGRRRCRRRWIAGAGAGGGICGATNFTAIAAGAAPACGCTACASDSGPWSPYDRLIAEAIFSCVSRVNRSMCVLASSVFPLRWYERARPNSAETRNGSISSARVNDAMALSCC